MGLNRTVFFVALVLTVTALTLTEGTRTRRQDEETPAEPPAETPVETPAEPPAPAAETPPATPEEKTPAAEEKAPAAEEKPLEPTPDVTGTAAVTTSSGPPKVESTTPKEWIEKAIKKHNEYRALHGAGPLAFNESLCQISQAYANTLATTFKPKHNPALQAAKLGENLYYTSNSAPEDIDPERAVNSWYEEIKDYDFKTGFAFSETKEILHFTQLVWKGTTDVGISLAKGVNPEGKHVNYIVANYFPRGNFDNFLTNVLPKAAGSTVEKEGTSGCGRSLTGGTVAVILAGIMASFLI